MPNLTSYHAPVIYVNRELPKTYCDLIQHEFDYIHFLRTHITNIQSSLAFTNKKKIIDLNTIQQKKDSYNKQYLSNDIYRKNFELCKRILQIGNGERKINIDCHNENYKKQRNISHSHLRQKRWKEKIENENKQFITSLT